MPQSMIYKHGDYMKQCGIDMELIMRVLRVVTALQQITSTLKKQLIRSQQNKTKKKSEQNNHSFQTQQSSKTGESNGVIMNRNGQFRYQLQEQIQTESFSDKDIPHLPNDRNLYSMNNINIAFSPKSISETMKMEQAYERIDYFIEIIHHQFVQYYNQVITLTYLFIKWRFLDICGKFGANSRTWEKLLQKKPYLNNTKNLFLKAHFLQDYLLNVKLYFNQIIQSYPITNFYLSNPNDELSQLEIQVGSLRTEIQLDYSQKNKISASRAVRQLRNLIQITTIKPIGSPFLLGFWVATVILIILTIFFILIFFNINFTTNNHFERTFPIWRGLWYFIYLIWLMGINTYIFNYFKINFNLLTAFNNYHLPNPSRFIVCAAIFTSIHFLLFLFYLIKLAQLGNNVLNYISEDLVAGISWLIFLSFFIFPIRIFYFRQRLYPLMMFFRSIVSPLIGVQFKFSIFMEIFVSFRQPFRDMIYTFTYYFIDDKIVYWDTIMYETVVGIVLYMFRIVQNCRMMYQNRLCGGTYIYSILKSFLGFITMIASYLSKNQTSHDYFYLYIWLLTALASTSLAYYMDLWNDWGLLDKKYGYLRKNLIFRNKKFYYSIMILNLVLRFVWMLNVSPDVLRRIPIKPYIVVMIVSSIQITRRGIWTIFRVEKEHISSQNSLNKLFVIEEQYQKLTKFKSDNHSKSTQKSTSQKSQKYKQKQPTSQHEIELSPHNENDQPLHKQATLSPHHQHQIIIKSPNWLQITVKAQDQIRRSNIDQLIQKNITLATSLNLKLVQAQKMIQKYTSDQDKFLS